MLHAILHEPAGTPPAGVTPNFHDPSNLHRFVAPIITLCLTFTTLAMLTRIYTKKFLIRSWAYEADLNGNYITLDEFETQEPNSAVTNGLTPTLADGPTTGREGHGFCER